MTKERRLRWELEGFPDGRYAIWVPVSGESQSKLLAGFLAPEEENGKEGWAIYMPSDARYGWHEDGMAILPGYVDEFIRFSPFTQEGAKATGEATKKAIDEAATQGD